MSSHGPAAAPRAATPPWVWALRLAVTAALAWWLWRLVDPAALRDLLARIDAAWWLALAGLSVLVLVLHAVRWWQVLRALGERSSLASLFADVMVGMTYNLVLPTTIGGDVVRAFRCARRLELEPKGGAGQPHHAWSSSVYERLAGLAATVLAALVAVLAAGEVLAGAMWVVLGLTVLVVGVFWRAELPVRWVARVGAKLGGAPERWLADIRSDFEGPLTRPRVRAWALAWSLVGVFAVVLFGWVCAWALGHGDALLALAVALPTAQLTSAIPVSINGLGLREGTIVLVLGAYGVDEAFAVAVALLLLAGVLFCGVLGLLFIATGVGAPPTGANPARAKEVTA